MKLSNKILVGFFGLMFVYLTAVFAEVRLRGTPNFIEDSNSVAESVDIPAVGYLVVRDLNQNVNVIGSDQPRLEVRSSAGNLLQNLTYQISGDTLILSKLMSDRKDPARISVFLSSEGLKGITVDRAVAVIKELNQDQLNISQQAGRIWMSNNRIGKINVEASRRSLLDVSGAGVDTLTARIEQSQLVISSPLRLLKGSMTNNAFLHVTDCEEIQFKKDSTSRLNWFQ